MIPPTLQGSVIRLCQRWTFPCNVLCKCTLEPHLKEFMSARKQQTFEMTKPFYLFFQKSLLNSQRNWKDEWPLTTLLTGSLTDCEGVLLSPMIILQVWDKPDGLLEKTSLSQRKAITRISPRPSYKLSGTWISPGQHSGADRSNSKGLSP